MLKGKPNIAIEDLYAKYTDSQILSTFLGINKIPCLIPSPLRQDFKHSFGFFTHDGLKVFYKDFATNEKGSVIDLFRRLWNLNTEDTIYKIYNGCKDTFGVITKSLPRQTKILTKKDTDLKVITREWESHDIQYWEEFGISVEWLTFAEVYPVKQKIIEKGSKQFVFGVDKHAYAFIEHKDGKTTIKLYQPFNTKGYKWTSKHDGSVISLWTKIPKKGKNVCICSSLKDALCLWANTKMPSIALQGEGYTMSDSAINSLKERFENIYILFDSDAPGLKDAEILAQSTGFIKVLSDFGEQKDISDFYKALEDKSLFKKHIKNLFKQSKIQ